MYSYHDKLRIEKNSFGFKDYVNHDICICGNDIIRIVLAAKKYSNINIDEVKRKINDKVDWYRKKYKDEYTRQFGNKKIDIFEFLK